MKKVFAFVLSTLMLLVLSSCGADSSAGQAAAGSDSPTTEGQATGAENAPEGERVKIGFICWGYTDAESRTYVRLLDFAGEACGFEPVYATYTDNEDIINQTETLIESGCKGIITIIATPTQMDLCEKAGVYLSQWASEIIDEDVTNYLEASEYWVGYSFSDNAILGEQMVEELYANGCRNLLVCGPSSGNAVHDLRMGGIYNKAAEYDDLTIVAEWRDPDWGNKISDSVTNYLNLYPEIDGIVTTGGSGGICDTVVQVLVNEDKIGEVEYATVDVVDDTPLYLEEGSLSVCLGSTLTDVVWLSIVMTNKVNGWQEQLPVSIHMKVCVMTSLEEYNEFITYVQGEGVQPFSAEEYQSITYTLNPSVTIEDIERLAYATSLEELAGKNG